jgi:uncharacterized protein YbcI
VTPGGSLMSKPTWWNTFECSATSAFFVFGWNDQMTTKKDLLVTPAPSIAQQLADSARSFQLQQTGHAPARVTVVMSEDTLVVTLHDALSPAEQKLAQSPEGAANLRQFHHELFRNSVGLLRAEIERITGRKVREAAAEVDPGTGSVVHAFTTGTTVQVFLLDGRMPDGTFMQNDAAASA